MGVRFRVAFLAIQLHWWFVVEFFLPISFFLLIVCQLYSLFSVFGRFVWPFCSDFDEITGCRISGIHNFYENLNTERELVNFMSAAKWETTFCSLSFQFSNNRSPCTQDKTMKGEPEKQTGRKRKELVVWQQCDETPHANWIWSLRHPLWLQLIRPWIYFLFLSQYTCERAELEANCTKQDGRWLRTVWKSAICRTKLFLNEFVHLGVFFAEKKEKIWLEHERIDQFNSKSPCKPQRIVYLMNQQKSLHS